ncbi:MAG TPA: efflux transporter outer membrane subunit [Nitrospiria bacterium]|jgi:multidrug efflux system outer membrane protein|nr:efflux transporter outer membrane subunit [Nitrospiria bacterium]
MTIYRFIAAVLPAALLSGCITVGPDYHRPKIDVPDRWPAEKTEAAVPVRWWDSYNDPVLDAMVDEALAHNSDLALAVARLDEARAQLGVARADQFPGVAAGAGASRNRISEKSPLFFPGFDPTFNDLNASVSASWEIDFWGKYRRATEAARADLFASASNRDAVRLALIADVARGYFNLRSLDAQIAVTRQTVKTRLDSLELQRKRFEAGVASELELHQVEADAYSAQALLPFLENQLAQQETALSVLLGRSPREIIGAAPERGSVIEAISVPPAVPAGLPSDLLERRPDLREAEQRLVAANARIGQAKAAYFPSIPLTGAFGTESAKLADLFTAPARVWLVSVSAAQTIFDAGRIGSQVEASRARERQALAQYRSAIQNAFKDTQDALVAQRKARERLEAEQARVASLQKALELARLRYDNGESSLLDVLDAERGLLGAQLDRVEAQRAQLVATADLFKALGGGWEDQPRPRGPSG